LFLFGAFSPITGDQFLLEMPECNTNTFQIYLNEFSKSNPDEFKIIVLDNGAFHKATSLIIPENIALIFLPPYSPELNPAEKMWAMLKRKFTGKLHRNLSEVSDFISEAIKQFTENSIKKTCGYDYVFLNINWTI
jgi:transposase